MHEEGYPSIPVKTYPVAKDMIFVDTLRLLPVVGGGILSVGLNLVEFYLPQHERLIFFVRLIMLVILACTPLILRKVVDTAKPLPRPAPDVEIAKYRSRCFVIFALSMLCYSLVVLLPQQSLLALICTVIAALIACFVEIAIWIILCKYLLLACKKP